MPGVISKVVLVLAEGFGEEVRAERVAGAISQGLTAAGTLACDACLFDENIAKPTADVSKPLDEVDFDRRMRAARAVVVACARLDDRKLAGSIVFEAATRARQSGVPAYAVTAKNVLDPFEARIVDLQVILEAHTLRRLSAAGRELAALV
jgi:glycerate 2-kinase